MVEPTWMVHLGSFQGRENRIGRGAIFIVVIGGHNSTDVDAPAWFPLASDQVLHPVDVVESEARWG